MSTRHPAIQEPRNALQEPRVSKMDVSEILSGPRPPPYSANGHGNHAPLRPTHAYSTRHSGSSQEVFSYMQPHTDMGNAIHNLHYSTYDSDQQALSIKTYPKFPKTVNFQLILSESLHHKARLPLRVHINAHDSTDSIITTVKNFYGLYEGQGVSFEDSRGVTLIAQYENLDHEATVHVRLISEHLSVYDAHSRRSLGTGSPQKPRLEEPFQMLPPQPHSRPQSRSAKKRSASPTPGRTFRNGFAMPQPRHRFRNGHVHEMGEDIDSGANGMSDSDAGSVSVTSSRRAKNDQVASAEISLDNIVEGGRRKRAKFESSELPLFAPPQQAVTASISSMSPQRRLTNSNFQSPMGHNGHYNFTWNHSLPSPQSNTNGETGFISNGNGMDKNANHIPRLRARTYSGPAPARVPIGSIARVLPTPDPTIGSVISDEDVALQLMRLGDASNLSLGRTSTSTMDDCLSGKGEAASSCGDTDEESQEEEIIPSLIATNIPSLNPPARKKQKIMDALVPLLGSSNTSGEDYDDRNDKSFRGNREGLMPDGPVSSVESFKPKVKAAKFGTNGLKGPGKGRPSVSKLKTQITSTGRIPPSPYAQPSPVRKGSEASPGVHHSHDGDDDDLSSKPRCQRCRKSKKGCDRQRPCQRCKDAGIDADGCISEDEGNGRKGRYGRHMGVTVKRDSPEFMDGDEESRLDGTTQSTGFEMTEGSKKRKRS